MACTLDLPTRCEVHSVHPTGAVTGLSAGLEEAHPVGVAEIARRGAEAALEIAVEKAACAIASVAVVVGVTFRLAKHRHVARANLGDMATAEARRETAALGLAVRT